MPSPKNTTRSLADVRAECIALGVQPGRSIAECEARLADYKAKNDPPAEARMSPFMRMLADTTAVCGTLSRNPLIYNGDMPRYAFAHTDGWPAVIRQQVRHHLHAARLAKQHGASRQAARHGPPRSEPRPDAAGVEVEDHGEEQV
jgi:hypothetical protein